MRKILVSSALSVTLLVGLVSPTAAGPPPDSTSHVAQSVTLSDLDGDILRSDGNRMYLRREASMWITDYAADSGSGDRFKFQPGVKRNVRIHTSSINGGEPFTCSFAYVVFTSATEPQWYEVLTGGSQASVAADAYFACFSDGGFGGGKMRWRVNYPDAPECAVIELLDAVTWRFTAPAYVPATATEPASGCLATLTTTVQDRGVLTETEETELSAPFSITATIP